MYIFIQHICHEQDYTDGQIFERSIVGFISDFSMSSTICRTKDKKDNMAYH